jgi:hypothetical protein
MKIYNDNNKKTKEVEEIKTAKEDEVVVKSIGIKKK